MTTGRINQVTARQRRGPPPRANPTRDNNICTFPTGKPNTPQTRASTREIRQRNVLANLSQSSHLSDNGDAENPPATPPTRRVWLVPYKPQRNKTTFTQVRPAPDNHGDNRDSTHQPNTVTGIPPRSDKAFPLHLPAPGLDTSNAPLAGTTPPRHRGRGQPNCQRRQSHTNFLQSLAHDQSISHHCGHLAEHDKHNASNRVEIDCKHPTPTSMLKASLPPKLRTFARGNGVGCADGGCMVRVWVWSSATIHLQLLRMVT